MARRPVSVRLWERLRAMGLSDRCGVALRPLRAPLSARRAGAWSWTAVDADGIPLPLGSHWPMATILAAPRLVVDVDDRTGDTSIDIELKERAHGSATTV
ncbi:hypothetical protein ACFFMN_23275 [Planobispora siamensis]|uniref:Uncharacterized protein n=1 Tax=Planobispora siamensis TaxID=936338 RepID=A0A8J3WLG9_9ACTN|nr:hypothetical protein [Planobispora siamensis]GIH95284.1 hypothetical protein Psi01_59140 [Planobispora siamensis]